jgi:antitoxin VapB
MAETRRAKLIEDGPNQCVLLPADFRFEGDEVLIHRDEKTQDVILSSQHGARAWEEFFAFRDTVDIPEDWMADRPLNCISLEEEEPLFREDE